MTLPELKSRRHQLTRDLVRVSLARRSCMEQCDRLTEWADSLLKQLQSLELRIFELEGRVTICKPKTQRPFRRTSGAAGSSAVRTDEQVLSSMSTEQLLAFARSRGLLSPAEEDSE